MKLSFPFKRYAFPVRPELSPVNDDYMRVTEHWPFLADGVAFLVHIGFITDGQSVPWVFEPLAGDQFDWPDIAAALPHDAAYSGDLYDLDGQPVWLEPWQADRMARDIWMQVNESRVMPWLKWAVLRGYYGVRGRRKYVTFERFKERHPNGVKLTEYINKWNEEHNDAGRGQRIV